MLINGEDKVARYSSSNPNGIRRFPYAGYPLTYANVVVEAAHGCAPPGTVADRASGRIGR